MDTKRDPQISVITITRNRGGFIASAIEGVLSQTFSNWELLVLDDASSDNTEKVVEAYKAKDKRIKYYKNKTVLGISKNRNLGLALAKGKYIAVLDSDDTWIDKYKLQKQFDFLEHSLDYVLIGSNIKIVDEKSVFIKETKFFQEDTDIRRKMLISNQIAHSSVLYRRVLAESVGGYDNNLSCVEDFDLFLKLGLLGKMKNLKECTTSYIKHTGGTSHMRKIEMAWNHFGIVWRNCGRYSRWFLGIISALLRIIKSLF